MCRDFEMTPEQKAAWASGQIAVFQCRLQGVIAENTHRENQGQSVAYRQDAFSELENEFSHIGFNSLIDFFRD